MGWDIIEACGTGINGAMFIASKPGGGVVGHVWIRERELPYGNTSIHRYAEITSLVVERDFRRQGAGTELVARAIRWAEEHGFQRVAVESSLKAVSFYEATGFGRCSVILDRAVRPAGPRR
jgi:GNAT superfamily N-acetyltransferase